MKNNEMTKSKKPASRTPQTFVEAAAEFEKSKITGLKVSRKIAWMVAGAATVITLVSNISLLFVLLNHKEPAPVVIHTNDTTGVSETLRSVKDTTDKFDEVQDKHWLREYVQSRAGYDWFTIGTEFEKVKLLSASDVATEYVKEVQAKTAPLAMLKDKAKIVAKVSSISFVGDLAQVRFTTERQSTSGENLDASPVQAWIATVAYKYEPTTPMTDQQRMVNPLGYKTISYRVDPEVIK